MEFNHLHCQNFLENKWKTCLPDQIWLHTKSGLSKSTNDWLVMSEGTSSGLHPSHSNLHVSQTHYTTEQSLHRVLIILFQEQSTYHVSNVSDLSNIFLCTCGDIIKKKHKQTQVFTLIQSQGLLKISENQLIWTELYMCSRCTGTYNALGIIIAEKLIFNAVLPFFPVMRKYF